MIDLHNHSTVEVILALFRSMTLDKQQGGQETDNELRKSIVDETVDDEYKDSSEGEKTVARDELNKYCIYQFGELYDGFAIVGYQEESICYCDICDSPLVMSAKFTGCLFAVAEAEQRCGNFIPGHKYAFHVHPVAYFIWVKLKKMFTNVQEMNPHEAFYGKSSGGEPVTAFISEQETVLWSKGSEKSLNGFPSNMDTNYYKYKFDILKQIVSLSIADKNLGTHCYI